MSIIKAFVDAFKKASTAKTPDAREHARSDGLLGPTNSDAGGSFEPLRPAPAPTSEPGLGDQALNVESLPVAEDPDAGGEVAASLKTNIDPAFTRRLRFAGDDEPATLPLKDAGDYKVEGIDSVSDGDSADPDLAERRAILSDFNFPKTADKSSPSIASSDPEEGGETTTLPIADLDLGAIEGADELVLSDAVTEEPERRLLTQVEVEGGEQPDDGEHPRPGRGKPESPDEEGSEEEGQLVSLVDRRESVPIGELKLEGDYKVEGVDLSVASSDPQEGGQVTGGLKLEGLKIESLDLSIASSDPEEGGEIAGGLKLEGMHKIEGLDLSIASSDPEEGGELTTVPVGNLDLAAVDGVELKSADFGDEAPQRRAPAVLQESGDPSGEDGGGHFGQGTPDNEDSGDDAQLVRLDRTGGDGNDSSDPDQIAGAIDDRIGGRFAGETIAGFKAEVGHKVDPTDLKFGEFKVQHDYKPEGGWKVEDGIKFEGSKIEGSKIEGLDLSVASSDPEEGGEVFGNIARKAGGDQQEYFKVQIEDVLVSSPETPAMPPGVQVPYPNLEDPAADGGDGAADFLARKAGGKQEEYLTVKMEDILVTRDAPTGGEPSDGDAGGFAELVGRKAGEGQKEFLTVKMEEAFITSEATAKGEHYKEATILASKPSDVRDSNDRYSNTDDDFESSTLLALEPEPAAKEMLPGLAGHIAETPELGDIDPESGDDEHPDEIEL